jgi:drug/metabolite transporter (DMT)-like permease
MSSRSIKLGYAALCVIWGTTWMAIRVLVHYVPPIRAAGIRLLIGAAVLLAVVFVRRLPWPKRSREWFFVCVLALTMMGIPFGLLFWAEQFVTSSMTAVFYATTPLIVSLLTPLVLKKSVPRGALMAMLCAVGAIAYLFNFSLRTSARETLGGVVILAAVLCSAISAVIAKREMKNVNAIVSTAIQLVVGGVALCAVAAFAEQGQPADWNVKSISALLFLALVGSAVAFTLWYALVKYLPPYKLTTTNLVVPFIAIAEGALILQESITAAMFITAVIVAGAVAVVLRAEAQQTLSLRAPAAD